MRPIFVLLKLYLIFMIRRLSLFLIIGLLCALVGAAVWQRSMANPLRYPVQGLDISHHQGDIDWALLGTANLEFVYIKATEGGDWVDPKFRHNWHGAGRAGLKRGGYHYFSVCRAGKLQAENFLSVMAKTKDALPAALDLEYGGFCGAPPDKETLLREARIWIDTVERATGKPVIIYTTRDFYAAFLGGQMQSQPLWLRSIGRPPKYKGRPKWTVWQWHHAARLPGIKGPVDRNAFYGTRQDFEVFAP